MFRANIDTPWLTVDVGGQSEYMPLLPFDPTYSALILSWSDVTGNEWHEYPVGSGQQVKGGNYAEASGHEKSGVPDYLTISATVELEQTLMDIDADPSDQYYVYAVVEESDV